MLRSLYMMIQYSWSKYSAVVAMKLAARSHTLNNDVHFYNYFAKQNKACAGLESKLFLSGRIECPVTIQKSLKILSSPSAVAYSWPCKYWMPGYSKVLILISNEDNLHFTRTDWSKIVWMLNASVCFMPHFGAWLLHLQIWRSSSKSNCPSVPHETNSSWTNICELLYEPAT